MLILSKQKETKVVWVFVLEEESRTKSNLNPLHFLGLLQKWISSSVAAVGLSDRLGIT